MRTLFLTILFSVMLFPATTQAAPAKAKAALPAPKSQLMLKIVRNKKDGRLQVIITNTGKKSVSLVLPGEGSDYHWRMPIVGWSVLPVSNKKAKHPSKPPNPKQSRCKSMASLSSKEVFDLAPNGKRYLTANGGAYGPTLPKVPGKYRVIFYYINDPTLKTRGTFDPKDPAAKQRFKQSTPCHLMSNELIFTVTK